MRPIKPASPRRPSYPRLDGAWRILLGAAPMVLAAPAHGDATVPTHGKTKTSAGKGEGEKPAPPRPVKVRLGGDEAYVAPPDLPEANPAVKRAPCPLKAKVAPEGVKIDPQKPPLPKGKPQPQGGARVPTPPRPEPPQVDGGLARPSLPAPPDAIRSAAVQPRRGRAMVLHLHGPDEPCRVIERSAEEKA